VLKGDSKLAGAPKSESALRAALAEKTSPIKTKFQETAGKKAAAAIATHGASHASPELKEKIEHGVRYEHNLKLGRIELPGTEQKAHSLYKPASLKEVPTADGRMLSFKYLPPHDKMHFTCSLDKNDLPREVTGTNLTLKTEDGRGKMGESPAHQANAGMHSAHIIADMIRGSGYRESSNLISTSSHYNLYEMRSAEREIANFVRGSEGSTKEFNLKVTITWEKLDSDASIERIIAKNPLWEGEDKESVKKTLKDFLKGFGSKLHRVMSLRYDVTVKTAEGAKVMDSPIERDADVYLGV
jgi:hypothetical protein